jgi:hypothetical protein
MTGCFLGNLFLWKMVEAINRWRPEGDQVDYFWWALPKSLRVFEEYRTLYPDGKYANYALSAIASGAVGMFFAGACIGIIPLSC